jgi:hypothetical protein
MGLAFLPWERLPPWLLGPLMILVGVFLVFHAVPFSWRQAEAIAIIVIGFAVFASGLKKLAKKEAKNESNSKEEK